MSTDNFKTVLEIEGDCCLVVIEEDRESKLLRVGMSGGGHGDNGPAFDGAASIGFTDIEKAADAFDRCLGRPRRGVAECPPRLFEEVFELIEISGEPMWRSENFDIQKDGASWYAVGRSRSLMGCILRDDTGLRGDTAQEAADQASDAVRSTGRFLAKVVG